MTDKVFSNSLNSYAYMYDKGEGVQYDKCIAVEYYIKVVKAKNYQTMNNYANFILSEPVPVDFITTTAELYKNATHNEFIDVMNGFSNMAWLGTSISVDKIDSISYYKKAIENKNIQQCITMPTWH